MDLFYNIDECIFAKLLQFFLLCIHTKQIHRFHCVHEILQTIGPSDFNLEPVLFLVKCRVLIIYLTHCRLRLDYKACIQIHMAHRYHKLIFALRYHIHFPNTSLTCERRPFRPKMKFYFNTFLMIILDWSFNLLIQCLFSRPWELCSLFKMWEININPDYLESGLKSPYSFIFKVVI